MAESKMIRVRGAREHNLKSVDLDIPRDRLVVMTGVSGSGKSSLAFDTIFAEGQRKYMESLSAYARQFLDQMQKPDVETIEGLPPTIAIEQRSGGHNPRSTVATTTEIYDYLRLLFARCGKPRCWQVVGGTPEEPKFCNLPIESSSASQIVDTMMAWAEGTRVLLCSPVIRGKKGFHKEVAEALQKQGFVRARVNGKVVDLREALKEGSDNPLKLGRYEIHNIDAVIDRVVIKPDIRQRLADSIEIALRLSEGLLIAVVEEGKSEKQGSESGGREVRFSEKLACPDHPECSIEELSPRLFSFNSPYGACPQCDGLGTINEFDEQLIVPDPSLPIGEGAIEPWRKNGRRMNMYYGRLLHRFCEHVGVKRTTPYDKLAKATRKLLLHGTGDAEEGKLDFTFEGVLPNLHRRYDTSESEFVKERLRAYMSSAACPRCRGRRLREESLHVMIASAPPAAGSSARKGAEVIERSIADVSAMTIDRAAAFFQHIQLTAEQQHIAQPILKEINARLGFLRSVGLNYLTLNRTSATLSGGEAQRIRLATQVGSGLVGVCYVLDEPTIGLHQRDNERLIGTLRNLADIGNTVLVVEHDDGMIRASDYLIDIGPGPGRHGGMVVAAGSIEDVMSADRSLTGQFLSGRRSVITPARRRPVSEERAIVVKGARANNLKSVEAAFPFGGFICVTGVSGSGKSTLVNEVLLKAALKGVVGTRVVPGDHDRVTGLNKVDRIVEVDQSPIGRTPRSNPATYTGIFDEIRKLFAASKESRIRGYEPGRFSFNVKGGRCEACQGQGVKKIEMHFLPDVFVTCEVCKGKRYNRETLEILFRHKTISDVLDLTIEDAIAFFESHPKVLRMLECLRDVGLDYVQLGQPSTQLSGGEAQRIKLASELGLAGNGGHTLYVLDEPTTGLHFADVDRLLSVLNRLADQGHTLVVIEHNLDVIKCADWVIDLGPEGGDAGGTIVATGTPEAIARHKTSYTGQFLKPLLAASSKPAGQSVSKARGSRSRTVAAQRAR